MDREAQPVVERDGRGVVVVDVEVGGAQAPGGEVVQAGQHQARPQALATVGKYAAQAVQGDAGAQKVMALMQSVKPANLPVPPAQNPWLQGLGALTQGVAALTT